MNARVVLAIALCAACQLARAQVHEVAPGLWDRPRTGASVVADASVKRAVVAALAAPAARILIHHGPGQEQLLQAEELRSWLGALAIDTRRVELRAGVAGGDQLKIEVLP